MKVGQVQPSPLMTHAFVLAWLCGVHVHASRAATLCVRLSASCVLPCVCGRACVWAGLDARTRRRQENGHHIAGFEPRNVHGAPLWPTPPASRSHGPESCMGGPCPLSWPDSTFLAEMTMLQLSGPMSKYNITPPLILNK